MAPRVCVCVQFSGGPDGQAHVVDADRGRRVHVRRGVRHQPGAGAAVPDHPGHRHGGAHAVDQLAGHRVPVAVHVLRRAGRVRRVPGLRPDQVRTKDRVTETKVGTIAQTRARKTPCRRENRYAVRVGQDRPSVIGEPDRSAKSVLGLNIILL